MRLLLRLGEREAPAPAPALVDRRRANRHDALLSHSFIKPIRPRPYVPLITHAAQQILGRAAERLALEHYERLGFELLAANHRTRSGELDLIVADTHTIVFVEVKARTAGGLDPLVSITPQKLHRLRRLAAEWLATQPARSRQTELRFDAVAVVIDAAGQLVALEQFAGIT